MPVLQIIAAILSAAATIITIIDQENKK